MRRLGLCLCLVLATGGSPAHAEEPPKPPAPPADAADAKSLAEQLASADLDTRRKAVYALYGLGGKAAPALPALAKALADEDEYVRTTAGKVIAKLAESPAMSEPKPWNDAFPALQALLKDPRPSVRRAGSIALWQMGSFPDRVQELVEIAIALLADPDSDLKANGAGLLVNAAWASRAAIEPTLDRASAALVARAGDGDDRVRRAVADALGALMHPAGFEALLVLATDPQAQVRASASSGLAQVKPPSPQAADRREQVLLAGLDDLEPSVRLAAADALHGAASSNALHPLLKAAREDPEANVRAASVSALGQLGDLRALARVRAALDDREGTVRSLAASALANFGPQAAPYLPALVLALDDEEAGGQAAMAIGRLGHVGAPALPALLRAVRDPKIGIMAAGALHSLAYGGALPASVLPAVLELLPGADRFTADNLAQALARFARLPAEARAALLASYHATDSDVHRARLVLAMSRVEPASEDLMVVFRKHAGSESSLARNAALGLVLRGTEAERARGIDLLLGAHDEDGARANAQWLLGRAGPAAAAAASRIEADLATADESLPEGRYRRLRCAAVLVQLRVPAAARATEILLATLRDGADAGLVLVAVEALAEVETPSPELIDLLVQRLDDRLAQPTHAEAAARALARLGSREPRVLEALVRASETPRWGFLRTAASGALLTLAAK